jgi:hypothetical protein
MGVAVCMMMSSFDESMPQCDPEAVCGHYSKLAAPGSLRGIEPYELARHPFEATAMLSEKFSTLIIRASLKTICDSMTYWQMASLGTIWAMPEWRWFLQQTGPDAWLTRQACQNSRTTVDYAV